MISKCSGLVNIHVGAKDDEYMMQTVSTEAEKDAIEVKFR